MNTTFQPKLKSGFISAQPAARLVAVAMLLAAALGGTQLRAQVNQSPLPFYEPFPSTYLSGEYLGSTNTLNGSTSGGTSGAVWDFGNSLSSSCARVQSAAALEYPGLTNVDSIAQSDGVSSYYKNISSTKDRGAALAIPASTTLYASCLVNFQNITNLVTQPLFGLSSTTPTAAGNSVSLNGAVLYYTSAGKLQIAKNSTTPATNLTYALLTNNTYLVVLRYKFNPGAPDEVDLWLNPTALGNNAQIPPPTLSTTNNANVSSFGSVAYFNHGATAFVYLDEVRVATDWAGVTPAAPAPGNIYGVSGGGSGCSGDAFNVGVSNSDAGLTYVLYTNGAPTGATATGTGSAITFGPQAATALYTVLATNANNGDAVWMSGSASVTVLAAPNIATQPSSVNVATNALCAFTVASAGSGLNFQWYRNGSALSDNGHYVGSQSPTLVITAATTADAATTANGYYVTVSSRCGSVAISTTNALTLEKAANLVWWGDGVSNLWDLAISTNWNYASDLGYATNVFNYGDNVTFDDTTANTTVTLNATNLSPSLITVNDTTGQAFTFNGSGTLAGGGSIMLNSAASLNLAVANYETGGITIDSGWLNFSSSTALGQGPINLAGGAVCAPNIGLVTVTNTINVLSGTNLISVFSGGGQPLALTGPINFNGGSIDFSNGTTKVSTPTIQLAQPGFTCNIPVTVNAGTISGSGLLLAGNNTTNVQVWNGLIDGAGSIVRSAAGGTTLLNNTNINTGSDQLVNGSLGLGVDSISILSPPTVDAGPLGVGTFSIGTSGSSIELFASGGPRVIGNAINYTTTNGGPALIIGGNNNLTLTGTIDLTSTNRVFNVTNTGLTVMSGVISDSGYINYSLIDTLSKTGSGILYLDGVNTYVGDTTNAAGILAGSGTLAGRLIVQSGATLGAGDAGLTPGTFTIQSDLLLGGNGWFRLNKALAQSNDLVAVTGLLTNTGAGTITVTNVNPAKPLALGDSFYLFSQAVSNGAALTVAGAGMTWSNHLAVDGGITAQSVAFTTANYPTNLTFSLTDTTLKIGWPATHLGWILQSQTNALGTGLTAASNTWHDVSITSSGTNASFNVNPANPAVFFRLRHP